MTSFRFFTALWPQARPAVLNVLPPAPPRNDLPPDGCTAQNGRTASMYRKDRA